ncbi:MAG TPA: 2-oxoacid:acceptor oxidoreductase family protein [Acidimicrobiales bacterium]|nr:2-oxoacid:acceptor oxidoreductase family protein [Acidimicrobiales bacterium]
MLFSEVRSLFLERELLLTGIGGQGVQLAAQVVAKAAVAAGRDVQVFGSYGGMMRGGNTDATVVVGDGPIEAPPTVTNAWSALLVHPEFATPMLARVRPDGLVLYNATLFEHEPRAGAIGVPATALGGAPVNASLVMVGAYLAVTGLVTLDGAIEAVDDVLPSYRRQHVPGCQQALRTGYDAAPSARADAWPTTVTA